MKLKDFIKVNDSRMDIRLFMNNQNITANGVNTRAKEILQYENYEITSINVEAESDNFGVVGVFCIYLESPKL